MSTPALQLSFTSATLDPRVTFTRTTSASNPATFIASNGYIVAATNNQARFNYNPLTLACNGLLIEESRINNLTYSNTLTNAAWSTSNMTVTASSETSPNGTQDAFLLTTSSSVAYLYRTTTFAASAVTYTESWYFKQGTATAIYIYFVTAGNGQGAACVFDLSAGAAGTPVNYGTVTGSKAEITPAGNGWYRCSITATVPAGNYYSQLAILSSGKTIHACNAQLEAGAFATSYIPTTTTALTRNADVAVMTGANFSDWWQANKGGVLVRARPGTVSGIRPWVQFDDGTANEIIALRGNTTNPELYIVDGGSPQAQIDAGTIAANTDYSLTGWWETNDCKARLDSGVVVADTSATIPTVTQARLGSDGTNYLNGHLASISYYDSFSNQIYTRRKNKAVFNLM